MPKNWLQLALIGFIALAMGLQGCGSKGGGTYSNTAGQGATTTAAAGAGSYTVKRGDTLYGISRSTGVPLRSLIDANGLVAPYTLVPGQVLALPAALVHTVAQGDTVYGISRRYGVEMSELARINNLAPPYTIKPGQQLALPSGAVGGELASAPASPAPSGSSGGAITGKPLPAPEPAAPAPLPSQPQPSQPQPSPPAPQPEPAGSGTPPATPAPTPAPSPAPSGPTVIPDPPARVGGKFAWPVDGTVVSNFGPKEGGLHNDGINIAAPRGTPVLAAENGVVAYAGSELKGFGNLILVKHEGGYVTAYAHNDQLLVSRGDIVRRGETIARVGSTGGVDSPQLHFEIRKGSKAIDPLSELAAN